MILNAVLFICEMSHPPGLSLDTLPPALHHLSPRTMAEFDRDCADTLSIIGRTGNKNTLHSGQPQEFLALFLSRRVPISWTHIRTPSGTQGGQHRSGHFHLSSEVCTVVSEVCICSST